MKPLGGIRGGHPADSEAPQQSENGKTKKQRSRVNFAPAELLRKIRAADAAGDNREKCSQLEYAIPPGKFFRRQQLREQPVFGRAKKRSLRAHQEYGRQS